MTDIEPSTAGVFQRVTRRPPLRRAQALLALAALSVACASKNKPEAAAPPRDEKSYYDDTKTSPSHTDEPREESSGSPEKVSDKAPAEPTFTEGMSVDEAIRAVPPGIERRNIDQETLGKPLQDLSLYESCKPGSARVKMRVAVWEGKAVGVDVTVTPKNEKLESCIKGKLAEVTWETKVKSLNTIEYQF